MITPGIAGTIFGWFLLGPAVLVLIFGYLNLAGRIALDAYKGLREVFPENTDLIEEQKAHALTRERLTSELNTTRELFSDREYLEALLESMKQRGK